MLFPDIKDKNEKKIKSGSSSTNKNVKKKTTDIKNDNSAEKKGLMEGELLNTVDRPELDTEIKGKISEIEKAKLFYTQHTSKPSFADTAKRFNIDLKDLVEIGRKEDWFNKRLAYHTAAIADQQEIASKVLRNIVASISVVSSLAIKEQALLMQYRDRMRNPKYTKNPDTITSAEDLVYKPNEVTSFIKLFMSLTEKEADDHENEIVNLRTASDAELEQLLSEDDIYELHMSLED